MKSENRSLNLNLPPVYSIERLRCVLAEKLHGDIAHMKLLAWV